MAAKKGVSEKSLANLKRFVKGQSGNPGGKQKVAESLAHIKDVTAAELRKRISNQFRMTKTEVEGVLTDSTSTSLDMIIASAIKTTIKTGDVNKAETLFNRSVGKCKEAPDEADEDPLKKEMQYMTAGELLKIVKETKNDANG